MMKEKWCQGFHGTKNHTHTHKNRHQKYRHKHIIVRFKPQAQTHATHIIVSEASAVYRHSHHIFLKADKVIAHKIRPLNAF